MLDHLTLMRAAAGVFILMLISSLPLYAHRAAVIHATPQPGATLMQPPAQVSLVFAEELQSAGSRVRVFNARGEPMNQVGGLDLTDPDHASLVAPLAPLTHGLYTVCWEARLLDGDLSAGEFTFQVGEAPWTEPFVCPAQATAPRVAWPWLISGGIGLLLTATIRLSRRRGGGAQH